MKLNIVTGTYVAYRQYDLSAAVLLLTKSRKIVYTEVTDRQESVFLTEGLKTPMSTIMKLCALISIVLTVLFTVLFHTCRFPFSPAITFGTFSYHFCMRLLVGEVFNLVLKNRVNYNRKWFHVGEREMHIYKLLHIKNWKASMPTYDKTLFDPRLHTWDEIAQAMCQAELVHETIIVFSFLPIIASIWFGDFLVFLITSAIAACYDLLFVLLQRSNRPRVLKIVRRTGAQHENNKNLSQVQQQ